LGSGMDKGLIWIELEDGFAEPGCPICNILAHGTRRYFSFFLNDSVLDPGARLRLVESVSWCARHTLLLLTVESREWPDHMGSATIFESLLEAARRRLTDALPSLRHSPAPAKARGRQRIAGRIADGLRPRRPCPVCQSETERESSFQGFFISTLFDTALGQEMKALYLDSEGLCYRHLVGCLEHCAAPEQIRELIEIEQRKLSTLVSEVSDYLRKHEHRYRSEPFGEEIDAWARAARKLAGHYPENASLRRLIDLTRREEKRQPANTVPVEANSTEQEKERDGDENSH
jgi:hypothetical protein